MQVELLEGRWNELFPLGDKNTVATEFRCLSSRYSEKHRAYHTLQHIAACLRWLDQVQEQVPIPRAVELALWFHDVVYNARKKNNELISAEYAAATLSVLKVEKIVRDDVRELIMVTQHPSVPVTENQRWMVDIDLAILGADPAVYADYAQRVRQEYAHLPDLLYGMGRKKVLNGFLQNGRIYFTDYFYKQLEQNARENMQREINQL